MNLKKNIKFNKRKNIQTYLLETNKEKKFVKEDLSKNNFFKNEYKFYQKYESTFLPKIFFNSPNKIEMEFLENFKIIKKKKNINKDLTKLFNSFKLKGKITKDEIFKEFNRNLKRLLISKPDNKKSKNKTEIYINKFLYMLTITIIKLKFKKKFKKRYSVFRIHSDLHQNNILIQNKKIKVIDWEDNKKGFYLTDLVFLNSIIENHSIDGIDKKYLKEYRLMFFIYNEILNLNSSYRKKANKIKFKSIINIFLRIP